MKKFILFLLFTAGTILGSYAKSSQKLMVTGSIIGSDAKPIVYVTVVLRNTTDSTELYGCVSDTKGAFTVNVPAANYSLTASFLGYKTYKSNVSINGSTTIPTITLQEDAVSLGSVVVTSSAIKRRADGFIVNVESSGVAKGRSTYEALAFAPGVMVSDGIKINGNGGTQVYVNNRLVNMSGKDLENYLQSISAEDVQTIEVIPISGTEYDASATGGIIKIVLRSQRSGGYSGAVNARGGLSSYGFKEASLGGNISLRKNKLSLYANVNYNRNNITERYRETTKYLTTGNQIDSYTVGDMKNSGIHGEINGVYDITDKQSIGMLVRYANFDADMLSSSSTDFSSGGKSTHSTLRSPQVGKSSNVSASLDYNLAIGSKGATFKANFDFNNNSSSNRTDFHSVFDDPATPDNIYYSKVNGPGRVLSGNVDFKIPLSNIYTIKAGAKLFNMNIDNNILYMDKIGEQWVMNSTRSEDFIYNETVGALYAEASASYGKLSAVLGIRGEYSSINVDSQKEGGNLRKNYLNPFPSLILFYNMDAEKGHSLSMNANMKISRPSYSMLRPFTIPLNEYTFIVGNPELNPVITSRATLTQTLFNKYSLTLFGAYVKDPIAQLSTPSEIDPNIIYYRHENIKSRVEFGASLYVPIDVTKWWKMTTNLVVMNRGETYLNSINEQVANRSTIFNASMNNIFKLPYGVQFDLSGWYTTPAVQGNMKITEQYGVDAGLSKSLLKDMLSLTLTYRGVLVSKQRITMDDPTFSKSNFGVRDNQYLRLSLRYNFRGGQKVNARKASSGNDEESGRL